MLSSLHSRSFPEAPRQGCTAARVRPNFCAMLRADHVSARLGHGTPPFCTMPCVKSLAAGSWCLITRGRASPCHAEPRIQQCRIACVIPPMYWSIGNSKRPSPSRTGLVIVRIGVAVEIPGRITNVSIVSVSRRAGPPHFGQSCHELRRRRQRRFSLASELGIRRQ